LPDADTISHFNLPPSYNIVSVINTKNPNEKVSTSVIA
jgi:hypothetical protein